MSLNLDLLSNKFNKKFTSFKKIYDGFDNNISVLTDEDNVKYIYRESLRDKPIEDMLFEKNFSEYLLQNNIPVRRILYMGTETLLEFCDGKSCQHGQITNMMAFNAGKILAKFHTVSKNFNVPPLPERKIESELLRAISIKDKLENTYINGKEFIDTVEKLLKSNFLHESSTCIIHNDFRIQNVLFNGEEISAILDFDWSCMGNSLKDLAHALVEWSFPDGGKFNSEIFKNFFKGYCACIPNIDLNALKYWIAFSCISDTATYLCDTINDVPAGGKILSWMYSKYLSLRDQDITKLTEQ